MATTRILNATIVNEGQVREADVLLRDGRIEAIGTVPADADQTIDAAGLTLLPGMVDDQVHFREPGVTYKADIATESRAAVAGGITSYMEMPNTKPPTDSHEALEDKYGRAANRSFANYSFYLGGTNNNLEAIKSLDPKAACGVKVFMGASTGNMLVDDPKVLEGIFANCPTIISTHCEDTPMILKAEAEYLERYGEDIPARCHPDIRSEAACYKSSSFAVGLAKKHGTKLNVLHLTTAKELELFETGPVTDKQISVEACVHHLYFCDEDYEEKGHLIKCNPAIKRATDRAALRAALAEKRIDVIGTDHAPHTLEEKANPYPTAPAGMPLVQHAVPMALELVHDGVLTLPDLVQLMCHNPALRFDVEERGFLREGYFGDIVLVDLDRPETVTRENLFYKCGWSPLEGRTLRSSVRMTFVNGDLVYRDGALIGGPAGQRLSFNR